MSCECSCPEERKEQPIDELLLIMGATGSAYAPRDVERLREARETINFIEERDGWQDGN